MKKSYYLFNPGRLSRKDNTLKFTPVDEEGNEGVSRYIPVEGVDHLFCFGSIDANSALFNFLGKQQITVHFFDYYEHYTGSFMPKDYLLSGKALIAQAEHYLNSSKRLQLAMKFVDAAAFNMLKNLRYYDNRDRELSIQIQKIEDLLPQIHSADNVNALMGIEGNIRLVYYEAFNQIIRDFEFSNREKRPPSNEVNALISFCNMLCYTLCLDMIYHTQLNPTISFLHEPGERRFSLALDLAEVFKPILVDRLVFALCNKRQLSESDFDRHATYCLLKDGARKKVIEAWEAKLNETIKHRSLKRQVSYRHMVKLECYKLIKHIMGMEEYKSFRAWW
jgi:CRISPR-associated protein Cas1